VIIRVVYEDDSLDMIPSHILQIGIECKKIKMFYRESEKRWITVGVDPVREVHSCDYQNGPERRIVYKLLV
jgi:hypothetical protein